MRTAFRWASERHKLNELDKFLQTLMLFYEFQDWYHEGIETYSLAVDRLRERLGEKSEQIVRMLGRALAFRAWFLPTFLLLEKARSLAQESLALLLPLREKSFDAYIVLCLILSMITRKRSNLLKKPSNTLKRCTIIGRHFYGFSQYQLFALFWESMMKPDGWLRKPCHFVESTIFHSMRAGHSNG